MNMQDCIDNCIRCHSICLVTAAYCLQQGGKYAESAHLTLLLDCGEICQTSANFMLRGSQQHPPTCGVCAQICEVCAQGCEQMSDDAQMKRCAEIYRQCAQSCHEMRCIAA